MALIGFQHTVHDCNQKFCRIFPRMKNYPLWDGVKGAERFVLWY